MNLPDGGDIFDLIDNGKRNQEDSLIHKNSCKMVRKVLELIPYEQRESSCNAHVWKPEL